MNSTVTPAVIALFGAGAVLLYLGLRRDKAVPSGGTPVAPGGPVRCNIADPQACAPDGSCVALFDHGTAPPGHEDDGICFTKR